MSRVSGSRHVHALVGSLGRLARTPFSTGLTVLVIAWHLPCPRRFDCWC